MSMKKPNRQSLQEEQRQIRRHRSITGTELPVSPPGLAFPHDCRAGGVIAVLPTLYEPRSLGGPLVCTIRFNQHARTVITHTNIARRMSWPKANNEVIASRRNQKKKRSKQLLQRRAKRGQRPGGNRRSDQAKRSKAITSAHLERIDFSRDAGPPA